jgi:hypothetical protein
MRLAFVGIVLVAACATGCMTSNVLFNGTLYANEAESKMLPGQHVPLD